MDSIQPKYQTANSLRSAIRSTGDSGIVQRIADVYKNVVPSCWQWRDLENRRLVKTIRWQCKPFGSVSQHICMLTRSRRVGLHAGLAAPPVVILRLTQDHLIGVRLCGIRLFRWLYGSLLWTHTVGNCRVSAVEWGSLLLHIPIERDLSETYKGVYINLAMSVYPRVNNSKTVQRIFK